jgi:hypothetical protein
MFRLFKLRLVAQGSLTVVKQKKFLNIRSSLYKNKKTALPK